MPIDAYIALGANLGDRAGNISRAVELLRQTPGVESVRVSSLLENPAVGGPAGSPSYLNGAALVRTTLGPQALLRRMLQIERDMGRVRRERWEPRVIDLDLILYGDEVVDTPELKLPHPRMHERRFVLQPLAEIAPHAMHPTLHVTVADLLQRLPVR